MINSELYYLGNQVKNELIEMAIKRTKSVELEVTSSGETTKVLSHTVTFEIDDLVEYINKRHSNKIFGPKFFIVGQEYIVNVRNLKEYKMLKQSTGSISLPIFISKEKPDLEFPFHVSFEVGVNGFGAHYFRTISVCEGIHSDGFDIDQFVKIKFSTK